MKNVVNKKNYLYRDFAAGVYLSEAQNPILHPPLHIVYVYTSILTYSHKEGGRGEWGRVEPEKVRGAQLTKLGQK